jgi:hypothetical protein
MIPPPRSAQVPAPRAAAPAAAVGVAVAMAALWLWVCWCLFPVSPWNDVRLAPSFALAHGIPVYPGAQSGAVTTWIYGPLPVLLWWPATWASSAAHAVMAAGAINLVIAVGAIAAVCAVWPAPAGRSLPASHRLLAAAVAVALWPRAVFQFLQADNVAEALGLLSLLILLTVPSRRGRWSAAVLAVAGLACKQTSVGVPVAEIVWLGLTQGWKEAGRHAGRCLAAGAALAAIFIPAFGWPGLRLNLLGVPGHLPWVPQPGHRLLEHLPALAVQLLLPLVLMTGLRRAWLNRASAMLLPSLAWLFSLPAGLAALFTIGGNLNSLQGFTYWLPPAVLTGLACLPARPVRTFVTTVAALAAAGICAARIWRIPSVSFRPLIEHYRQADALARSFPDQIWFPWNPLVTIYREGRFYHVEDGLFMRLLSGHPLTVAHLYEDLPRHLCVIALPRDGANWGLAVKLAPPGAEVSDFGLWTLHSWSPTAPPRATRPESRAAGATPRLEARNPHANEGANRQNHGNRSAPNTGS